MSAGSLILLIGFLTEGFLSLIWFLAWYFELITPATSDWSLLSTSLLVTAFLIPLLLFNYLLFLRFPSPDRKEFLDSKVYPLCQALNLPLMVIISLLAGIGEELFFRDLILNFLNSEFGATVAVIISSLLFAIVHFIGQIRNNIRLIVIYFIVGIYFGIIYLTTKSVLICITIHCLYDLLAMLLFSSKLKRALP